MPRSHHLGARAVGAHRLLATTAATAALTLILAACGGTGTGDAGSDSAGGNGSSGGVGGGSAATDLDGGWELVRGTGPDGAVPLVASAPITLMIEGTRWGGTAACNTYTGEVRVDAGRLASDGFAVTEMYCMDDDVMASEAAYLAALQATTQVTAADDELVLTGPDVELVFRAQAPVADAEVVGTTWQLTELIDGDGPDAAVSSIAADAELELSADGRLAGSTGCNRLMGGYELDGDTLVATGPLATTRMACVDDAATQQERHVLEVLEAGPLTVEVAGARLQLTAPDGRGLAYRTG
jgi:heat shock protein HslJ